MSQLEDRSKTVPTISIVDDDDLVREAMKSLMRSLGYDASTFGSAEEFLCSEQISRTSCLITDLHMPGLNGLDLQERLTAQGYRFPIIFLTAYPDEDVRMRAMKAGAVDFLSKPCNHRRLLESLDEVLKAA
jgi:FixJ family two-component response regulator